MPIPSRQKARDRLGPFHVRIRRVVERAYVEWRALADCRAEQNFGPFLYPRTIANIMFDAIARHAIDEFGLDPDVHVEIEAQTIKLFFKGDLVTRFKKGGDDGLGQNIATQAALAFMDAEGMLPGMPPETMKVEIIWLDNDLHTKLEHVLVVARDHDRLLWKYEIDPSEEGKGSVIPFPTPPTPPRAPPDTSNEDLVKPKTPPAEDTKPKG